MPPVVCCVLGTRPEAIKFAPVVAAMRTASIKVAIVATGQHPDLAPAMLAEAGLAADLDLALHRPGASPAELIGAMLRTLPPLLEAANPGLLLVQGDTASALGGALAATYARVAIGHVEAGLRSGDPDEPFPEETHRRLIAPLAALHFAPTRGSALALLAEGVAPEAIHVTGNSGIDAALAAVRRLAAEPALGAMLRARFAFVDAPGPPLLLATAHRRENHPRMGGIAAALARLALDGAARIMLPVHPSPAVADVLRPALHGVPGVHLLPPLSHMETLFLLMRATLVLTDSGGLQEEAPALGRRVLVMRGATERPEGVAEGCAELVGTDPHAIVAAVRRALAAPPIAPAFPYGDGRAGGRIALIVQGWLARRSAPSASISATKPGKLVATGEPSSTMTG